MNEDNQRPAVLRDIVTLTVRPVSDWHVGTGTGIPGMVNAQVRRDRVGLPYLPGTTLTGVLRDACRTVALALDDGESDGTWMRWHRVLFGDAPDQEGPSAHRRLRPAVLAIGPARLDPPLRAVVAVDPELVRATTFVKAGVRIDPNTGRALDKMLRFVEMARAGLPLRAEATLALPDDPDGAVAVTALLVLGAAWCDRIGGDRRRGSGEVELTWGTHRAPIWARWLQASGWSPQPPQLQPTPSHQPTQPRPGEARRSRPAATSWVRIPLTITTEQPVRVPHQTAGNLVCGHDHLPGRLLLPWLSQRLGAQQVQAAVADEALTVRHGYPEITGQRAVPAPFVLAVGRYPEEQTDGTMETWVYNTLREQPDAPARQTRDRWTLPEPTADGGVLLAQMALQECSHNAVNRATQRPDSESGLYTVEAIPAGRRLRTEILLRTDIAAEIEARLGARWWTGLDGAARLGARRRGEYGAVTVRVDEPPDNEPPPDVAEPRPPRAGEVVELWAAADLVVRSPRLRLSADPADVVATLRDRLDGGGLVLALEPGSAARTQRRDAWQSAWQLPRDSVIGLAAGSVLRVRVDSGVVDAEAWRDVLLRGLGERRVEGFGEILPGAPLLAAGRLRLIPAYPATAEESQDASAKLTQDQQTALDLLTRVARDAAVRHAARVLREQDDPPAAYSKLRSVLGDLSASQQGTWRTLLADAVQRRDRQRADSELRRWRDYRGKRRSDQRAVAQAVANLLDGEITSVLAALGTDLADDGWARLEATAVLLDDLVDAARRGPETDQSQPAEAAR